MKLVLDEHVARAVADALGQLGVEATALAQWMAGAWLGRPDDALLHALAEQQLVLVTYDQRTIPPLFKEWGEAGQDHGGVIFVDERTVAPSNIGGLVRGLLAVHAALRDADWRNRIVYLRHGSRRADRGDPVSRA